eukprot:g32884.t1
MQVLNEPFELMNQVLRGRSLLCVLSTVDVYERLWCLLEMSCAVDLGVEVNTSRKPKGRGAWALDEAFLTACGKPVDWGTWRGIGRGGSRMISGSNTTVAFRSPAKRGSRAETGRLRVEPKALRKAIESTPKSYGGIDRAVETARLTSLSNYRDPTAWRGMEYDRHRQAVLGCDWRAVHENWRPPADAEGLHQAELDAVRLKVTDSPQADADLSLDAEDPLPLAIGLRQEESTATSRNSSKVRFAHEATVRPPSGPPPSPPLHPCSLEGGVSVGVQRGWLCRWVFG